MRGLRGRAAGLMGSSAALALVLATALVPAMPAAAAGTQTVTEPTSGIVATSPATYGFAYPDCPAGPFGPDTVTFTNIGPTESLNGWIQLEQVNADGSRSNVGSQIVVNFSGTSGSSVTYQVNYPGFGSVPVQPNGTAEYHVDLSVGVFVGGNQVATFDGTTDASQHIYGPLNWDTYCIGIPAPPPPTGSVAHGMTATIGFWHNKNGQALINSFNGGSSSTALANWLASQFPNLYGQLAGETNAQIANLFLTDFNVSGMKVDAQVLATALATYATSSNLAGGTMASKYGFTVTSGGIGSATYNVGSNGAAFGVPNGTTLTVLQILQGANAKSSGGVLDNGDATLLNMTNNVFSGINQTGDIL